MRREGEGRRGSTVRKGERIKRRGKRNKGEGMHEGKRKMGERKEEV
jgi:hypothetical protein